MVITKQELLNYVSVFEKEKPIDDAQWYASLLKDFIPLLKDDNLSSDDLSDPEYIKTILQDNKDNKKCKKILMRKSPELYIASILASIFISNKIPVKNNAVGTLTIVDKDELEELVDATRFFIHLTDNTLLLPPCCFPILSRRLTAYSDKLLHDREVAGDKEAAEKTLVKNDAVYSTFKENIDLSKIAEHLKKMNHNIYEFLIISSTLILLFLLFCVYPFLHLWTNNFYFVIVGILMLIMCAFIFLDGNKGEAIIETRIIMRKNTIIMSDNVAEKIVNQLRYNVKHNHGLEETRYFMESDCDTYYCSLTGTKLNIFVKEDSHAEENADSM